MTLVVAQRVGSLIAVVSDTGVMKHGERLPFEQGIPKIGILTRDLAVAFAGDPDLAKLHIRCLPEGADYQITVDLLLKCHIEANYHVDYLVLCNQPEPKIVRISGGEASAVDTAWIGDKAAFEVFQRYRNSGPSLSVTSVLENPLLMPSYESETHPTNFTPQLVDSIRYVINDPDIETVFGLWLAANNANGEFKYIDYALVLTERLRWTPSAGQESG